VVDHSDELVVGGAVLVMEGLRGCQEVLDFGDGELEEGMELGQDEVLVHVVEEGEDGDGVDLAG